MLWVRLFEVLMLVIIPAVSMILKYLGIFAVTYVGVGFALNTLMDYLKNSLTGMPAHLLSIIGLTNFDIGINIYFSAVIASMILKGLDKATDKKKSFVFKA